jgi:hypothetical protein
MVVSRSGGATSLISNKAEGFNQAQVVYEQWGALLCC